FRSAGSQRAASGLSGAQAKTALTRLDGRWGVPHGELPTTHILKPAIAGMTDHDINEHICMDAAHRAALLAARTSIQRFGGEGLTR
nr:HipA domain-containing protein [Actinomycetota bacterium]